MQEELLVINVEKLHLLLLAVVVAAVVVTIEVEVVGTIEEVVEDMVVVIEGIGAGITTMIVEEVEVAGVALMVTVRVEMMVDMARLPQRLLHMVGLVEATLLCRTPMVQTLPMEMILLSLPQQAILVALDHYHHHMVHQEEAMVLMLLQIIAVVGVVVVRPVVDMVVVKDIQVVVMVEMLQCLLTHLRK